MDKVYVKQVIVCTKKRRGSGIEKASPLRIIKEIFDFNGELIAENDSIKITIESLIDFIKYRFPKEKQDEIKQWIYEYFIEGNELHKYNDDENNE